MKSGRNLGRKVFHMAEKDLARSMAGISFLCSGNVGGPWSEDIGEKQSYGAMVLMTRATVAKGHQKL